MKVFKIVFRWRNPDADEDARWDERHLFYRMHVVAETTLLAMHKASEHLLAEDVIPMDATVEIEPVEDETWRVIL